MSQKLIKDFWSILKYSLTVKNENAISNAQSFYEVVYDIGRSINDKQEQNIMKQIFVENDVVTLKETFQPGFISIVNCTRGLVNNISLEESILAKRRLSQMWFLKNEIIPIYKQVISNDVVLTDDFNDACQKLKNIAEKLEEKLEDWSDQDTTQDYIGINALPNLNGVPNDHYWWTDQEREISKNSN
jgi:hypothetical protein